MGVRLATVVKRAAAIASKKAPTILFSMSVVAFGGSVITAIQGTPKAIKLIEEATEKKHEELTKFETAKAILPAYLPTAACFAGGCTLLLGGAGVLNKRLAVATSSLEAVTASYNRLYRAAESVVGEKDIKKIKDAVSKEYIQEHEESNKIDIADGEYLCMDSYTGVEFSSNQDKVSRAFAQASLRLQREMTLSMAELYDMIGIDRFAINTPIMLEKNGWNVSNGDIDAYFNTGLSKSGKPCLVITYYNMPNTNYKYDF